MYICGELDTQIAVDSPGLGTHNNCSINAPNHYYVLELCCCFCSVINGNCRIDFHYRIESNTNFFRTNILHLWWAIWKRTVSNYLLSSNYFYGHVNLIFIWFAWVIFSSLLFNIRTPARQRRPKLLAHTRYKWLIDVHLFACFRYSIRNKQWSETFGETFPSSS